MYACDTTPVRFGFATVVGHSMAPTLGPGQTLLVAYGRRPVVGRLAVARFADGTVAVKRVAERRTRGWWLLSDNPSEGVDSRHRGAVTDADVLAVVVARIWPRPGLLRRASP